MGGSKVIIYLAELNKPIRTGALILYLNAKYEEEKIKDTKETYLINLVTSITKAVTGNKNIKSWTELEKKFNNDNKDNRSAKEIEEDVLNKFRNLEGQG